jgi:two-component system cell cycle response regulator
VRSSRDELACSMNRLGETLSSTHDLPKLLAVVLEAAVQARRAKAGSLLLLTADRTALAREATHGLAHRDTAERIPVGQGVAGTVAATGRRAVHPGRRRGPLRGQAPGPGPVVTAGHRLLPLTARPGQAGAGRPGSSRIAV